MISITHPPRRVKSFFCEIRRKKQVFVTIFRYDMLVIEHCPQTALCNKRPYRKSYPRQSESGCRGCLHGYVFHFAARCKKVTICPRVQVISGEKVVSKVPVVIFFSTARFTASAYHASALTSEKPPTVGMSNCEISSKIRENSKTGGVISGCVPILPHFSRMGMKLSATAATGMPVAGSVVMREPPAELLSRQSVIQNTSPGV